MDIKKIAQCLRPAMLSPDVVYLDTNNPRFVGKEKDLPIAKDVHPADEKIQERMRLYIERHFDTADLIQSIEQVGFLTMDRIVVRKYSDDVYIVIEGNRRLAAIKHLLSAEARREISLRSAVGETLRQIEVLVLESEEDIDGATWFLQGIRHISGIRDWGPYQQAQLVSKLMDEQNMSFTDAGKAVGAGRKKTAQMLRAYKGLKQMETDPIYGDKASPDLFSHFEQAWVKMPLREWLNWNEDTARYDNQMNLQLFYQWITEDNPETGQEKLKAQQVRDLLSNVIKCEQARRAFINNSANLDMAHGMAMIESQTFANWHLPIDNAIQSINKIPWSYEVNQEDIEKLESLIKTASDFLSDKEKSSTKK